jgi:hypothetical protein
MPRIGFFITRSSPIIGGSYAELRIAVSGHDRPYVSYDTSADRTLGIGTVRTSQPGGTRVREVDSSGRRFPDTLANKTVYINVAAGVSGGGVVGVVPSGAEGAVGGRKRVTIRIYRSPRGETVIYETSVRFPVIKNQANAIRFEGTVQLDHEGTIARIMYGHSPLREYRERSDREWEQQCIMDELMVEDATGADADY